MVQKDPKLWSIISWKLSHLYILKWCALTKNRRKVSKSGRKSQIKRKRTKYWRKFMNLKCSCVKWKIGPIFRQMTMIGVSNSVMIVTRSAKRKRSLKILSKSFSTSRMISRMIRPISLKVKVNLKQWTRCKKSSERSNSRWSENWNKSNLKRKLKRKCSKLTIQNFTTKQHSKMPPLILLKMLPICLSQKMVVELFRKRSILREKIIRLKMLKYRKRKANAWFFDILCCSKILV